MENNHKHSNTAYTYNGLYIIIDTILERDWKRTLLHGHSTKEATQVLRRAPVLIQLASVGFH